MAEAIRAARLGVCGGRGSSVIGLMRGEEVDRGATWGKSFLYKRKLYLELYPSALPFIALPLASLDRIMRVGTVRGVLPSACWALRATLKEFLGFLRDVGVR